MKYKVLFWFRNDLGEEKQSDYTNDGKGYSFNDAREIARRLRQQGKKAEVVNMRGNNYEY